MSDNNGIPFNLLTEEEVEELFKAGTLRTEVSEGGVLNGGIVEPGMSVPGDINIEDTYPGRLTPIQFFDTNGHPTCYPELTCGKCESCKIRQAAHAYFGGSPNRKIMMAGAGKTGVINNPGGFKRGELSMISYPRPSDITGQFRKHLNSPFLYNLEEGWEDMMSKLISAKNADWINGLRDIGALGNVSHVIRDVELDTKGQVIATSSLINGQVNVGTIGHVDHTVRPSEAAITINDNAIVVGGKVAHKFPTPPVKYYFGLNGDHYGNSASHSGRYGALPSTLEYGYNPLLLKPAKKPKREAWAQAAVDKMIVNKYLDEKYDGNYPLGAMRSPALVHNAKRALKNKGLKEKGVTLGDLFGKK